jgi:hypothetical protein
MNRGQLPARSLPTLPRGRPRKNQRPHPICRNTPSHIMSPARSQPESSAEVSLGVRGHAPPLKRAHAPPRRAAPTPEHQPRLDTRPTRQVSDRARSRRPRPVRTLGTSPTRSRDARRREDKSDREDRGSRTLQIGRFREHVSGRDGSDPLTEACGRPSGEMTDESTSRSSAEIAGPGALGSRKPGAALPKASGRTPVGGKYAGFPCLQSSWEREITVLGPVTLG